MTDVHTPAVPARDGPVGIGGWLILPTIGLCLTPLQGLIQLGEYSGLGENLHLLTSPQLGFIVAEALGNFAIGVVMPVILLVMLFSRKPAFPRVYVGWAITNLVFVLLDLVAAKILFGQVYETAGMNILDAETAQSLFRAVILVGLWVPYMLTSRRVRNTFVQ
jgi:hypothetical protein